MINAVIKDFVHKLDNTAMSNEEYAALSAQMNQTIELSKDKTSIEWWRLVKKYYTVILPGIKSRRMQEEEEYYDDEGEEDGENTQEDEKVGLAKYVNPSYEIEFEDIEYPKTEGN